jgi:energy-coupling factor transporter ATP-binding protein EcfA2
MHVKTEELKEEDIVIAVMGPTGSGKSTFINVATGVDAGVGHELESCTSEIGIIKMVFPGSNIVFVDTPGFDDTKRSDSDILKMISDWLEITFERKILLSGLLYFHRISDNRMAGTPLKNLRMFEELCGKKSFKNVILTTTMWDEVEEETGIAREEELKSNYWKSMIARDSSTGRFVGTRDSAFRLIAPLLDEASTRNELLLQKELVDLDLKLSETHAGQKLRSEIRHLAKQQQELLRQIREELKNPDNATSLQELMEEYEELRKTSGSLLQQMADLQVPLGKQFQNAISIRFGIKSKRNRARDTITGNENHAI